MGSLVSDLLYIRRSRAIITILAAFCIGINGISMVPDLTVQDAEPDTWYFVLPYVFSCELDELPHLAEYPQRNPLKWWLNCLSFQMTENYKLIPAIFGIAVMPLVYLLGYYITQDRFIGLISVVSFTANPLYTDWVTQGTYDQVWSFFFVLSLVILFKGHPQYSSISFVASIAAKSMAIMLLPIYLYTIYKKTRNISDVIMFAAILSVAAFVAVGLLNISAGTPFGFYPERWEDAVFRNISLFWQVIPGLALLIVINRNFIPKQIMPNQKLVALWMVSFFLLNPIVYFFTLQDTYSYRYVPLAAFMSIFAGMTIVNLGNWIIERKMMPKVKDFA